MNHAKASLRDNTSMINTSCLFINTSRLAVNTQPGHTYLQVNIVTTPPPYGRAPAKPQVF